MATPRPRHPRTLFPSGPLTLSAAVIAALLVLPIVLPSHAATTRDLAGWWLAIDGTFPQLWRRDGIRPMEELLLINRDGRVENRVMHFDPGTAAYCAETKVCSDAPLVATARMSTKGNRLTFSKKRDGRPRFNPVTGDGTIKQAVATATPAWTVAVGDNNRLMTLRGKDGKTVRRFARVAPERLRRLRAGMVVIGLPAIKHWRCFLANATAGDAAFVSLHNENTKVPDFLKHYLKGASYLMTLNAMAETPTPDDPESRKLIGFDTEQLLVEEFDNVDVPINKADRNRLRSEIAAIVGRASEAAPKARLAGAPTDTDVSATARPSPRRAPNVRLGLGKAEIAALARANSNEPAAKALFCRD